jgi:hypothetical protein
LPLTGQPPVWACYSAFVSNDFEEPPGCQPIGRFFYLWARTFSSLGDGTTGDAC